MGEIHSALLDVGYAALREEGVAWVLTRTMLQSHPYLGWANQKFNGSSGRPQAKEMVHSSRRYMSMKYKDDVGASALGRMPIIGF